MTPAIGNAVVQLPQSPNLSLPPTHTTDHTWSYHNPSFQQGLPFHVNPQDFSHHFVQPHINPRFASVFGLSVNTGLMQPQAYNVSHPGSYVHSTQLPEASGWVDDWTVQTGVPNHSDVNKDTVQ
jgi:H/ACA ribonucleoprotein complex non-core subunit NAF1